MRSEEPKSLMDCMSSEDLIIFGRLQAIVFFSFLIFSVLAYVVLKLSPVETLNLFFNNATCRWLIGHLKFDYGYFRVSTNPEFAPRVWLTELVVFGLATMSSGLMFLYVFVLVIRGKLEAIRIQRVSVFSSAHSASLLIAVFVIWGLYSGLSGQLILGHFRFSFGPNDAAIWYFLLFEMALFVGVSFGVASFCVVLIRKFFETFFHHGVENRRS